MYFGVVTWGAIWTFNGFQQLLSIMWNSRNLQKEIGDLGECLSSLIDGGTGAAFWLLLGC